MDARLSRSRPSIGEIRRRTGVAMVLAAILLVLVTGYALVEVMLLIIHRFVSHAGHTMLPSAVEAVIRVF